MNKFPKNEKITLRKEINTLFSKGEVTYQYPLKLVYNIDKAGWNGKVKVLISVPARNIGLAVKRNRIKRQIREIYRRNKHVLYTVNSGQPLFMAIIYISNKNNVSYQDIEYALLKALHKVKKRVS